MTNQQKLIQQKEKLMSDIEKQLASWDQSVNEALRILTENNEKFELLRTIDSQLTEAERVSYNKKHKEVWNNIIQMQEKLNNFIRLEKDKTEKQLVQMGKKEKIVSNYIDIQKESGFIKRNY